jgi:hypothetical protein
MDWNPNSHEKEEEKSILKRKLYLAAGKPPSRLQKLLLAFNDADQQAITIEDAELSVLPGIGKILQDDFFRKGKTPRLIISPGLSTR